MNYAYQGHYPLAKLAAMATCSNSVAIDNIRSLLIMVLMCISLRLWKTLHYMNHIPVMRPLLWVMVQVWKLDTLDKLFFLLTLFIFHMFSIVLERMSIYFASINFVKTTHTSLFLHLHLHLLLFLIKDNLMGKTLMIGRSEDGLYPI